MATNKTTDGTVVSRSKYNSQKIIEVMAVFRKNSFNYQKTSDLTGVSRNTLKSWVKEHPELLKDTIIPSQVSKTQALMNVKEESVLTKYYANQTAILDMAYTKLKELIPQCKKVSEIMEVVKVFKPEAVPAESENMTSESVVEETVKRLCYIRKTINKDSE